jgi:cytochrome c biogenesis protein CcmG/thiol:disulfide interchange protein DsbE
VTAKKKKKLIFFSITFWTLAACAIGRTSLKSLDGAEIRLDELRGRVVLLDFWATWCEPCKLSLPFYATLDGQLRDRGLSVVAVSTDESDGAVRAYLSRTPLPYTIARDPRGQVADGMGVQMIPTTLLLDRKGAVRFRKQGFAPDDEPAMRREVEKLLAE